MDDQEEFETDSPATRLLDALGRGDLNALLVEFRPTTIVRTEDQTWSVQGEDETLFWLEDAFGHFPGLVFDSHARHVGFGQVIEEARVRDIAAPPLPGAEPHHAGDETSDWGAPTASRALVKHRDPGTGQAPPLDMPIRLTVLHDDRYVHEIIASYPRALLRAAMGLHVDPLDMAVSEIQSAFVAPSGSGFRTYQMDNKPKVETEYAAPLPVPLARVTEDTESRPAAEPLALEDAWSPPPSQPVEDEDVEKPGRRRALLVVPLVALLVAGIAGGTWWLGRDHNTATAEPPRTTETTPVASEPTSTPTSASPSPSPTETPTKNPTKKPSEKPDVVFQSDLAFAINSAELSRAAERAIADLADQVRKAELTGTIEVHGYTDSIGSAAYGRELSLRRANAVADYLTASLDGYRIRVAAYGHGENDPVASNATEAGRKQNRRVTLTLPDP